MVAVDLALRDRRGPLAEQRLRGIPAGAVPLVPALAGDRRQRLEHDPVGQRGGDVGMVVGRRDLDHVHPHHRQLQTDPPDRVEQLAGGQPTRLRGASARGVARVADVDVDGQEHPLALVGGDRERLGQALGEPAVDDLGHLVGAHVLRGHPVQGLRGRPVAAQPDLQEPVPAQRTGLDQPAHRLAVPPQRPELDVPGVGVRVEVDHRHPALAEHVGAALGIRKGDRVVAAEGDRDRAGPDHLLHCGLQRRQRGLDVSGVHLDVTGVIDLQVAQSVGPQGQRGPGSVVRQVVGHPDRLRARTGCRTGRRCRRRTGAQDHHVGVGVRLGLVEVAAPDAEEGDVGAELRAVSGHDSKLQVLVLPHVVRSLVPRVSPRKNAGCLGPHAEHEDDANQDQAEAQDEHQADPEDAGPLP